MSQFRQSDKLYICIRCLDRGSGGLNQNYSISITSASFTHLEPHQLQTPLNFQLNNYQLTTSLHSNLQQLS